MATILIVDDLAANRTFLVTLLGYHGHQTIEAANGSEGLAACRHHQPDLVITDVLMPVMDGYELVKQLRLDPETSRIPVVFYTAHYGEREAKALALANGVSYVLTKPAESQTVLTIVARALSGESEVGPPPETAAVPPPTFDREHLRLVTDKLSEKVGDLRTANARLRALINIGLELASERDAEQLLQSVCVATRELFAGTYVTLGILDRTDHTVVRIVACGVDATDWIKIGDTVTGILGTVVAERRTLRGDNRGGDPTNLQLPMMHPEIQAFIAAPIASPTHVYGWICLVANEGLAFSEDDEHLVLALAGQVGRIYENGHLGQHDFLTDLPNRMLLHDRVTQALSLSRRDGHSLAILFFDLDRFKRVNDSLGHAIGDLLLQSVARRLVTCVRSSDTVSRHGGDEFVVLVTRIVGADDAASIAQKIIAALAAPHQIAGHELHVTATIGISISPGDGADAETLIRCADTAMYHAKEAGPNRYQFFEAEMNARAVERQSIEAGLHRALGLGEFVLHYQPRVDLETGAMTGAEALIRWMHPERGMMLPADFVPIAEDCGLMVPIGQWAIAEACRQARVWMDAGRAIPVTVNVSAIEFRDPRFLVRLRAILSEVRLDASYLELELTESSLVHYVASTTLALQALRDMGVQVAIDGFGTGYLSLNYLRQFPTNVLKIDRSFIQAIGTDPIGTAIVCAVISMGRSLGHRVVAEGVETDAQLAFLKDQQCNEGQGHRFSPPLPAEEFGVLLGAAVPPLRFRNSALAGRAAAAARHERLATKG